MHDYFKGYVPTEEKKSKISFKNTKDLLTLEEAQKHKEFAGVLADDSMFIDIDDFEQSEILLNIVKAMKLNCTVLRTSRGKHFYFKNKTVNQNHTKIYLAVGLLADIKTGKKASYGVLRIGGKDREILHDCDEMQELPKWLTPLKGVDIDFVEVEEGRRNQTLFNYVLTLTSFDFTKRQARECIRLINGYVLKDPLPDDELEVILRDGAFPKDVFYKDKVFLFDKFALALKNNCNIIKIDNQLHLYQGGIYVSGKQKLEYEMLRMYPQMNRSKRGEVFDYLSVIIQEESEPISANLIAFRNGVYDIVKDTLLPFSPDYIITNRIDWDYNPNAKSPVVDEVLDNVSCRDPQIRALLEEIAGYCFYRRNELGKSFILTGDRSNGKSTYLDMIRNMLGKRNVSALDLADLNERFRAVGIFGKLANIGDDIGDEYIPTTNMFKKMVTGSEITVERKGEDAFDFVPYAKLLFSANNVPRLGRGKDAGAIKRRLIIVPFEARFDPDSPNFRPFIKDELKTQESMEYLIMLGIAGLKRVLTSNRFTESEKVNRSVEEYEEINNPILGFFKELLADDLKIENEPTAMVYKQYVAYSRRNGLHDISQVEFSRQVRRHLGYQAVLKRLPGMKPQRVFVKKETAEAAGSTNYR